MASCSAGVVLGLATLAAASAGIDGVVASGVAGTALVDPTDVAAGAGAASAIGTAEMADGPGTGRASRCGAVGTVGAIGAAAAASATGDGGLARVLAKGGATGSRSAFGVEPPEADPATSPAGAPSRSSEVRWSRSNTSIWPDTHLRPRNNTFGSAPIRWTTWRVPSITMRRATTPTQSSRNITSIVPSPARRACSRTAFSAHHSSGRRPLGNVTRLKKPGGHRENEGTQRVRPGVGSRERPVADGLWLVDGPT
jgi:hypothetical protein